MGPAFVNIEYGSVQEISFSNSEVSKLTSRRQKLVECELIKSIKFNQGFAMH